MGLLMFTFFFSVIQNASIINSEIAHVKDGPYPVSVATGRIETDLVRLETIIEHMAASRLETQESGTNAESSTASDADTDAETATKADVATDTGSGTNESTISALEGDIQDQIGIIRDCSTRSPERIEQFQREFNLLTNRLAVYITMCWHSQDGQASYDELYSYAQSYLLPVIQLLFDYNQLSLDAATDEVDSTYDKVTDAVSTMFLFSIVMLVAVVVMVGIYMVTFNLRKRFERQLRETLNEATLEANEANAAKSAFLANMSHDIRTPMNAIVGLTTIASENIDDKLRVRQCLTRIATSSQHLLSLINDVLDMNKIESGKVALTQEEFSINELASEIETIFRSQPQSHKRNSEVVLRDIDYDLLIGDMMRLRQILLNLTSNALKYTNDGDTARMIISEQPAESEGRVVVTFVVEDSGIGMTREFVQRIFEPFERERSDATNFTEGTGLGMAITKNLVELMGGTIDVESELGVGTRVTFQVEFEIAPEGSYLRLSEGSEGAAAEDGEAKEEAAGFDGAAEAGAKGEGESASSSHAKKPKGAHGCRVSGRVLIVEDNDINMEIAQQLVSSRGAEVDGAVDGIEAVAKVSEAPDGEGGYDLIFMDLQMPNMDGIEATRTIRKLLDDRGRDQIPIVAMTANAFENDRRASLEAGMDDFMPKPINIHQLEEMLVRYLEP